MKAEPDQKKQVLLLSQYFWPEQNTTSWLMTTLGGELVKHGFDVVAITGQPTYRAAEKVEKEVNHEGMRIVRVHSTRLSKNSKLGRILNTATFTASVFFKTLFWPRADVIIPVTNPPLLHWLVKTVHLFRRTPYILLIHDIYPHVISAVGMMKADSPLFNVWNALSRWSYRSAARIVSLGACMSQIVRQEIPASMHGKIVEIPNWDDGDLLQPLPRKDHPLLKTWGLEDQFVVLYAGNIGLFHEIKTAVEAADKLRHEQVSFVFVGDGGRSDELKQMVSARGLTNVHLFPYRPKSEMRLTLTACDVGLVTLMSAATGLCVPSKLYGILACGKPVLGVMDKSSETARTLSEHDCGKVFEPGDGEVLAEYIRELKRSPELLKALGENARRAFEKNYTLSVAGDRYSEMVNAVVLENQS